jgi:hypothetical protein
MLGSVWQFTIWVWYLIGEKEQEEDELQGYYYKPKSSWAVV